MDGRGGSKTWEACRAKKKKRDDAAKSDKWDLSFLRFERVELRMEVERRERETGRFCVFTVTYRPCQ